MTMAHGRLLRVYILLFLFRVCASFDISNHSQWFSSFPWSNERIPTTTEAYSFQNWTLSVKCPYVSTCIYDHTRSLTATNDTVHRPCCTPCTSGDVTRMRCCPDISPCTLPSATPSEAHKMCVPSIFRTNIYDRYIFAIATCKEDSDGKEKAMCLQEYDANNVHPLDILPVTDVNFETYRNVHCAMCNGLQRKHVKFWSLRVICSTSNINMTNYSDIVGVINKIPFCDMIYERPYYDTPVVYCSPVITSCNVTGANKGDNYEACAKRPVNPFLFVGSQNMVFKNNACMWCNGYDNFDTFIYVKPDFPHVSIVLDHNSLAMPDAVSADKCSPGTMFSQKSQCIEVKCSPIRQLQGDVCEKAVRIVDSFYYSIVFHVIVNVNMRVGEATLLVKPIGQLVDTLLKQVFMKITIVDVVYEASLVADTNMTGTPSVVDIATSKLLAIEVKARVKNSESHDPEEKLDTLLHLIKDKTFVVFANHVFTISITLRDDVVIDSSWPDNSETCDFRFRVFDDCFDVDVLNDRSIVKIPSGHIALVYYGKTDNTVEWEFFRRPISTERNILEFRKCPFVKMFNRDVQWAQGDHGLLISSSDIFLPYSEFLYGQNDGEIWVCMNIYDALHGSGNKLASLLLYQIALVFSVFF